jgi:GAF domain-containing protein
LCSARYAFVYRLESEMVQLVGHHYFSPEALEPFRRTLPHRLSESCTLVAQAMLSGEVVGIDDIERHSVISASVREVARAVGYRSVIAVPMMREGRPLGAIALTRSDERGGPHPSPASRSSCSKRSPIMSASPSCVGGASEKARAHLPHLVALADDFQLGFAVVATDHLSPARAEELGDAQAR